MIANRDTIISLHLPKTAGKSFAAALHQHFGNSYLADYSDHAMSKQPYDRCRQATEASISISEEGLQGVQCVHGHFLPLKYLLLGVKQNLTFITWMRDPAERIISHYHYFQNLRPIIRPHHRRIIEERWSLERFCLSLEFQNVYSQYLYGFPLAMFKFIGITEYYEDDLSYFAQNFLEGDLETHHVNVGAKRIGNKYEINSDLRQQIEAHHSQDLQLYQKALKRRLAR